MIGNKELLSRPKTAFLSSRKITPDAVMAAHAWAVKVREEDCVIISGFQSELEKNVLKFLLRGTCPIIIVEARKPRKVVPAELREAFDAGRILFVSLPNARNERVGETSAMRRNRFVIGQSDACVFGALDPDGNLARLAATFPAKRKTTLDQTKKGKT